MFSMYYKRSERHWRVAVFFGGAAVAGAFGGILAYLIGKMDGVGGKRGWAWFVLLHLVVNHKLSPFFVIRIFILEGSGAFSTKPFVVFHAH